MKKLVLIFCLLPTLLLCQNDERSGAIGKGTKPVSEVNLGDATILDGTTMEEWLYATKGYKDDVTKGKDASKSGYTFNFAHEYFLTDSWYSYTVTFTEMRKNGKIRATIIKVDKSGSVKYYALPTANITDEVGTAFLNQLNTEEAPRLRLLLRAINDYYSSKS